MKNKIIASLFISALASLMTFQVNAGVIAVAAGDFNAGAGLITFSEYALGTVNPTYNPGDYGGDVTDPIVNFDGFFTGQSISANPGVDCPGAAPTACIVGTPTGPLSLDAASPDTFITNDGANPTTPVLSGTPTFNGGIAILFSEDQFGVGFDGGFFNAIGSTGITAFDRDGNILGTVSNTVIGIEFLGLVTDDNTNSIAGVFLDLVGNEPAGFAIDNIRFGLVGDINVNPVAEPPMVALIGAGLILIGFANRKKRQ